MKNNLWRVILPTLMALIPGCACDRGGNVRSSDADLAVVWNDADGKLQVNRDALYDFGMARRGERVPKKLVIRNLGTGPLTLLSIEPVEGDAVSLGNQAKAGASFEIRYNTDTTIGALEEIQLDMFFTPQAAKDPFATMLEHGAKLTLKTVGPREGEDTAVLTLKGTSEPGACSLPKELDFGKVPLGELSRASYTFSHFSPQPGSATVGSITGTDASSFKLLSGNPGDFLVEEGKPVTVQFGITPSELRSYQASVRLKAPGADCPEGEVLLKAEAVSELLTWTPKALDFGYTSPGTTSTKSVVFVNVGNSPVVINNFTNSMPSDFIVDLGVSAEPGSFAVPGGSVPTPLNITCKPSTLGPRSATLKFKTSVSKQTDGEIKLTCFGGGPDIQVTPASVLSFGQIGYVAGATSQAPVSRRLTVMNVGTKPPNNDANGNLKLGTVGPNGPGQAPFVSILPLNGTTLQSEFSVGLSPTYNASVGLEATAGKNLMDLTITVTPQTLGNKEAELTLYSNDPDEPAVKIRLTADTLVVPPCRLSATPAQLNFGLITPPTYKDLPVVLTNLSSTPGDICLVSAIDIAPGSASAFSVVGGAIPSLTIDPGKSATVVVRANPQGAVPNTVTSLSGFLQLNVSNPAAPRQLIKLSAQVGSTCLTIAPDNIDYGAVRVGCNSTLRTFSVYNTCSQTVRLNAFSVPSAAGQPAGGPNCPGTQPCAEFSLVSTPTIPPNGLPVNPGGTPITFQARYRPLDIGADFGAIGLTGIQNGQTVTYLVSLAGKGDLVGEQVDTFQQDAKPKADILLTIDNSGSMGPYQNSLSNNFASFISYANSANVDYQLGVTTTDDFDGPGALPGSRGELLGNASNPKVLSSSMPNVASLFQAKVKVGTNGSAEEKGLATSTRAVTPPLVTGENAGLIRPEANLAIVVITDALDQSDEPVAYYYNRLMNVKGINKANMFTFNVIGPFSQNPPQGCVYDEFVADDGRWASMVSSTSGFKEEICNTNWSVKMQDLGKTAFGFRTTFYLNSVPDLTGGKTIEVKINGNIVVPGNYSYDSAANAIVFNPLYTPAPGDTLSMKYIVACL